MHGGGLTDAMGWRFTVYLQLSICGLSMARPPSLLICIFFLGDTGDGDALLSPSPSIGRRASERRGDPFPPRKYFRKVREDGASPHHTISLVMVWGAVVYVC